MATMTEAQLDTKIKDIVGSTVAEAVKEALAHLDPLPKGQPPHVSAATGAGNGEPEKSAVAPELEKGELAAQAIRCLAAGKGNIEAAAAFGAKMFGKDSPVVKALSTDQADAGGYLAPEAMSNEVIELLRPQSVIMSLRPNVIRMNTASFTIPKLTSGASASYIGENVDIPATQPGTGTVRLTFRKLAALVPVSNDMLRYGAPGSDSIIRDDLVSALRQRGDLGMLRDNGTEDTPRGLRYQAVPGNLIPASATVNLANVTFDLGQMILALLESDVRMIRPGFIFSPRSAMYLMTVRDGNGNYAFRDEMLRGTIWGFPFRTTTQIPANLGTGGDESEAYLADFADVVVGEGMNLTLDASNEAAYLNQGGTLVSAFSRDQTVVRAIMEHDIAVRHPESVVILTGVAWNPVGA